MTKKNTEKIDSGKEFKGGPPPSINWNPDDHRKDKRLEIARFTIKYSLIGLMVFGIAFLIVFFLNTLCFQKDIKDEMYFLTLSFSALFNILTLSLGFVAGSSID